jgi:hypothetical protein
MTSWIKIRLSVKNLDDCFTFKPVLAGLMMMTHRLLLIEHRNYNEKRSTTLTVIRLLISAEKEKQIPNNSSAIIKAHFLELNSINDNKYDDRNENQQSNQWQFFEDEEDFESLLKSRWRNELSSSVATCIESVPFSFQQQQHSSMRNTVAFIGTQDGQVLTLDIAADSVSSTASLNCFIKLSTPENNNNQQHDSAILELSLSDTSQCRCLLVRQRHCLTLLDLQTKQLTPLKSSGISIDSRWLSVSWCGTMLAALSTNGLVHLFDIDVVRDNEIAFIRLSDQERLDNTSSIQWKPTEVNGGKVNLIFYCNSRSFFLIQS